MKKVFFGLIVVMAIFVAGYYLVQGEDNPNIEDLADDGEVKEFVLTGENFKFMINSEDNPTLRVNEGDMVRIEFSSVGGMHDFVIDEFGSTEIVTEEDGVTSVEFVASEKGEFEYYCSVGQHRANGMFGSFIVE